MGYITDPIKQLVAIVDFPTQHFNESQQVHHFQPYSGRPNNANSAVLKTEARLGSTVRVLHFWNNTNEPNNET